MEIHLACTARDGCSEKVGEGSHTSIKSATMAMDWKCNEENFIRTRKKKHNVNQQLEIMLFC